MEPAPRPSALGVFAVCLAAFTACATPAPLGGDGEGGSGGTPSTSTGGQTATGGAGSGAAGARGGSTGGTGTGGTRTGGTTGTGTGGVGTGGASTGGAVGSGGVTGNGGARATATGGTTGTGGTSVTGSGGTPGVAGSRGSSGGATGTGGIPTGSGGTPGTGGLHTGGTTGSGGTTGTGGAHTGGTTGTGGAATGGVSGGSGGSSGTVDCNAAVPSGGTQHSSSNASGTAAGLSWTIWSNGSGGSITTYGVPAFSAAWNNSGDFLARLGLQWNQTKTYDQYGTIAAQYAEKKSGSGGGYSYIGIYGWSASPCVEFYIVDDSYNKMPVNPGNTTNKGMVTIDGGSYILYTRNTSGTGGSKCAGVSNWAQYYSVRTTARSCGQISVTDHFNAWAAAGMPLGKMDQVQLLVEVGGGSGSVDFPIANITAQ